MMVLKCDICKKETEMVFKILINQNPYTVKEMINRKQFWPLMIKNRYLCDKCYEEVMSLIYPQGDEE